MNQGLELVGFVAELIGSESSGQAFAAAIGALEWLNNDAVGGTTGGVVVFISQKTGADTLVADDSGAVAKIHVKNTSVSKLHIQFLTITRNVS